MNGKRPSYADLLRALTALHHLANGTALAGHPSNMDARILIAKADGISHESQAWRPRA